MIGRALVVFAAAVLASACQPLDPVTPGASDGAATEPSAEVLGNPDADFPATLDELLAFTAVEAGAWQDEPVPAELTVWLLDGAWTQVRVTFVAADADRILTISARPDEGQQVSRPHLPGLGLASLPSSAVAALPPLPESALEPDALAEAAADALAACDLQPPVVAVSYLTGAPAAWDGSRWDPLPTWRATVLTEQGGVSVDPSTGRPFAPLVCTGPI